MATLYAVHYRFFSSAPSLERLVCNADGGFKTACRDFVTEYVFDNMDEDDPDEDG